MGRPFSLQIDFFVTLWCDLGCFLPRPEKSWIRIWTWKISPMNVWRFTSRFSWKFYHSRLGKLTRRPWNCSLERFFVSLFVTIKPEPPPPISPIKLKIWGLGRNLPKKNYKNRHSVNFQASSTLFKLFLYYLRNWMSFLQERNRF